MISYLFTPIYSALSAAFNFIVSIFDGIGIRWVDCVCMMVLVSVVLRLFTASFVGSAIHVRIESARDARANARSAADAKKASIRSKEEARYRERLRVQSGRSVD